MRALRADASGAGETDKAPDEDDTADDVDEEDEDEAGAVVADNGRESYNQKCTQNQKKLERPAKNRRSVHASPVYHRSVRDTSIQYQPTNNKVN